MTFAEFREAHTRYVARATLIAEKLQPHYVGQRTIDDIYFNDGNVVRVCFTESYRGDAEYSGVAFSSDAMDLPDGEVDAWCRAELERRESERKRREATFRRQQAKQRAEAIRTAEANERRLYERLKAKYEPQTGGE